MQRFTFTCLGTVLLGVSLAVADKGAPPAPGFWLVPSSDGVEARSGVQFPNSSEPVVAAQLIEANAVSVAGKDLLTVMGPRGMALSMAASLLSAGRYYAVATVVPVRATLDGATFDAYLNDSRLNTIATERRHRGETGKAATVQFQRYAKGLLQHSGSGSMATVPMGQRLEIIPLIDPIRLKNGDTLRLAVRFEGRPAKGIPVQAGYAGQSKKTSIQLASDSAGRVSLPLSHSGLWFVQGQVMRKTTVSGLDWETATASLTFTVR